MRKEMKMLKEALTNLASPAEQQIEYLERIGTAPSADELALELDDIIGVIRVYARKGLLSASAMSAIDRLDERLAAMSGPQQAVLWTVDALRIAEEWAGVRLLAADALARLEAEQQADKAIDED